MWGQTSFTFYEAHIQTASKFFKRYQYLSISIINVVRKNTRNSNDLMAESNQNDHVWDLYFILSSSLNSLHYFIFIVITILFIISVKSFMNGGPNRFKWNCRMITFYIFFNASIEKINIVHRARDLRLLFIQNRSKIIWKKKQ